MDSGSASVDRQRWTETPAVRGTSNPQGPQSQTAAKAHAPHRSEAEATIGRLKIESTPRRQEKFPSSPNRPLPGAALDHAGAKVPAPIRLCTRHTDISRAAR